ncbi:HAD family hydrolase [Streptomyces sp. H27-G5]|uniref:HAD family hydrolase n=1 Tax=Streptomyces sp. H27-G5 TaxID=2996698 RepID=UPI0022715FF9|nr:HAD family hydrolase [Streptomyces sp. H27-G5]MCY0923990.1 HAD family hydrolase [Streptomyces sp. H27-G5]
MLALFDLDGTLIDRQAALSDAVTVLCRSHGFNALIEQWLRAALADRANPSNFVRLRTEFGLAEPAEQLWGEYVDLIVGAVTCRPEVREGLRQLRAAAWTIGIVTNGASDIQRAKLNAVGLADLVDGIAASGDVKIRKPARELFELAASRCGCFLADGGWMIGDFTDRRSVRFGAEQGVAVAERSSSRQLDRGRGWMVGDGVETDVLGGHRAGLNTVWVSHGRTWPRADVAPDLVVDDVVDAAKFLLALDGQ